MFQAPILMSCLRFSLSQSLHMDTTSATPTDIALYRGGPSYLPIGAHSLPHLLAFANEITSLDLQQPITMASFDVESFMNVPLLETTEIIVDNIQTAHLNKFGLTKDSFKKLLNIAAHLSVFSFNNDLYTQADGVAMGSPLGPSYANAFLCHREINWLKQCPPEFRPVYYRRYIDDTFVLFKHLSHVNLFLSYLNSKHQSIKFTCETQHNNQLPFLDTYVTIDNGRFHPSIYRKPTFTGLGLHFLSNIPYIYKINSIRTFITGAYNLCSNWSSFHNEMKFLNNFFVSSGYPLQLFDKITDFFM
nr:uncharacterized protein LOC113828192 [Penaeus vannamei]